MTGVQWANQWINGAGIAVTMAWPYLQAVLLPATVMYLIRLMTSPRGGR